MRPQVLPPQGIVVSYHLMGVLVLADRVRHSELAQAGLHPLPLLGDARSQGHTRLGPLPCPVRQSHDRRGTRHFSSPSWFPPA